MFKEFIPYEEALALKELGFDEECFKWVIEKDKGDCIYYPLYDFPIDEKGGVPCPLFQQAFRGFREKYNLRGFIGFRPNVKKFDYHIYDMSLSGMEYVKQRTMEEFNKDPKVGTYEEAELACLRKLIEIVKQR